MKLLVLGTLATLALVGTASAQTLSADAVQSEIIGKTVCMETPRGEICVRHNADGTTESISGMPARSGSWRFDGDQHCVTWEGEEERCSRFEKTGSGYANSGVGPITLSD